MAAITEDYKEKLKEALNSDNTDYEVVRWIEQNFPELKESGDEKIRKELIEFLNSASGGFLNSAIQCETFGEWLAWLEKQGRHQKFIDAIQIGDKVTRSKNGGLVNFSQLERVAKPAAWSEEDERMIQDIINDIAIAQEQVYCKSRCEDEINWLKFLKDRVGCEVNCTTTKEWSEEDERIYKSIIYSFAHNYPLTVQQQEFVKSLKSQNTWKPSDEQMKALDIAIRCGIQLGTWEEDALKSLKEQLFKLKKLRKE